MARETHGWTERQLMWEMRFAKLLVYQHAALRGLGAWTVPPKGPEQKISDDDFDRLLAGTEEWL
ncbi:MAG: hypothetical protein P4L99_28115 [Chthoniobacter sp.]|nr:hypothetical protein [Chthoniobacter sp.]